MNLRVTLLETSAKNLKNRGFELHLEGCQGSLLGLVPFGKALGFRGCN